jgi:carboxynorspermidine decarboxylase
MTLSTPYYLIDESRLLANLEVVDRLRARSGARALLALKCFASWGVADLLHEHLDGTTSSSLYEARLGREEFGGEVHAYSVAFTREELTEAASYADKVILNSVSQLNAFADLLQGCTVGLRVNPGISHSSFDLADPARAHSRLGVVDPSELAAVAADISGLMFHFNCENTDAHAFIAMVDTIAARFGDVIARMDWISLGGGLSFTVAGYAVDVLADGLRAFADRFAVQVYLEPGDAVITGAGELVTTVLDVVHNDAPIAIVDASIEAHLPDQLLYGTTPPLSAPPPVTDGEEGHRTFIAGRTCLAGDVFGEYRLPQALSVGDEVRFADAGGYTIVKASWFNGLRRPAIAVRRLDGTLDVLREFSYEDFRSSLS